MNIPCILYFKILGLRILFEQANKHHCYSVLAEDIFYSPHLHYINDKRLSFYIAESIVLH